MTMDTRALFLLALLSAPAALGAQNNQLSGWSLTAQIGLGTSAFSYASNPPFEHAAQGLIRIEVTRTLQRRVALNLQGTLARKFFGDYCIGIDRVCAPPLSYKSLSAAIAFLPGRTRRAGGQLLALGAGLYRLPNSRGNWNSGAVPASTAGGIQASVELPFFRGPSAPGVTVQGVLLPHATSRTMYLGQVLFGWRFWFTRHRVVA